MGKLAGARIEMYMLIAHKTFLCTFLLNKSYHKTFQKSTGPTVLKELWLIVAVLLYASGQSSYCGFCNAFFRIEYLSIRLDGEKWVLFHTGHLAIQADACFYFRRISLFW